MTIPVARSLRILGACIHVAIVSPCTLHRCTIRKMPSKVPLCDACTPNLLLKIEQQYMTPQDKSTLIRSQIVPAMLYAPYSCTPTQTWIKSTLSLLYQAITNKSYYALRLAQGGLQFTDPKTPIAHRKAANCTSPRQERGSDECGLFALAAVFLLRTGCSLPVGTFVLRPLRSLLPDCVSPEAPRKKAVDRFVATARAIYGIDVSDPVIMRLVSGHGDQICRYHGLLRVKLLTN